MAVNWTDEQRQVIKTRGRNILVSAAAGSGKTAVLVERIMERILDKEDPVNIDELLIVTFTKAAAGEMRERITERIADARDADPENAHLMQQTALIPGALITTIDGFCAFVCRNYGHLIGLVPGQSVAEAGEVTLMKQDALADVLADAHAEEDPDFRERFLTCIETYATGKNERPVEDAILRIAGAAESAPDPEGWMEMCRTDACADTVEALFETAWMHELMADAAADAENGYFYAKRNLELTEEADGPEAYRAVAESEYVLFAELNHILKKAGSCLAAYERCRQLLIDFQPLRLPGKKPAAGQASRKFDLFKEYRKVHKDIRDNLLAAYFPMPAEDVLAFTKTAEAPLQMLIELAQRFRTRFQEIKASKQKMDFSDLEHYALQILRDEHGRTYAARELAARFREVMIDEYQDSNYLQEEILTAVSRNEDGEENYFCVGDVKQSIYSFRQARPELFLMKEASYDKCGEVASGADAKAPSTAADTEAPDASVATLAEAASAGHPDEQGASHIVSSGARIDLHRNFRSRTEVIDAVNGIFEQIMCRGIGGVEYDEDAALVAGADYPSAPGMTTEMIAVLKEDADTDDAHSEGKRNATEARELEARAIGARIRELVADGEIYDRAIGGMRRVMYRDIVILLRTMEGWADTFSEVLTGMRIPNYSTAKSGYFTAQEVQTVLQFLAVTDNPRQDIPFAAVLTSAFAGVSAEELALIRTADLATALSGSKKRADVPLYDAARAYAAYGETGQSCSADAAGLASSESDSMPKDSRHGSMSADSEPGAGQQINLALKEKLRAFFAFYDSIREAAPDTPLHELISRILMESGFYDYACALPGGAQRAVNLDMLIDKAAAYEETSYSGLFNFIRYIDNLQKYSQDFGELSAISEQADVVRIYSIHKSKGLEYPIVFVAGMSKNFNMQDANADLLIHPSLGIAASSVDLERRTKAGTLKRTAIRGRMLKDSLGEELRVLYVALTRAQQKLIMTGTCGSEKDLEKMALLIPDTDRQLPAGYLRKCRDAWHFLYPAALRMSDRAARIGVAPAVQLMVRRASDLVVEEIQTGIRREDALEMLRSVKSGTVYDAAVRDELERRFSYAYPHAMSAAVPVEISVSEMKKAAIRGADGPLMQAEEAAEILPASLLQEAAPVGGTAWSVDGTAQPADGAVPAPQAHGLSGAERGTAYHRVCELLDFAALASLNGDALTAACAAQMREMTKSGRLTEEEMAAVRPEDIAGLAASPLGQRMAAAHGRGGLVREQPFVLGMDASEIREDWPQDEMVFVQGIIDAFFYEYKNESAEAHVDAHAAEEAAQEVNIESDKETDKEKIILVDYKTDRVREAEELVRRYRVQLDTYAEALERVTGLSVAEKKIWSFALLQEVTL